jgi:hypothetical protein
MPDPDRADWIEEIKRSIADLDRYRPKAEVAQQEEIRSLVRSSGPDGLLARLKQKTTELSGGSVR